MVISYVIPKKIIKTYFYLIWFKGFWFSPEADFLRAVIDKSQENIDGTVNVAVFKGNVYIKSRESKKSLYNESLVRYLN